MGKDKKKRELEENRFSFGRTIRAFFKGKNVLITILAIIVIFQYVQTNRILGDFSILRGHSSSLIDEVGQLRGATVKIGSDLAEVRSFLRMPVGQYGFEDDADTDEETEVDELQMAFFRYFDNLASDIAAEKNLSLYREMLVDLSTSETLIPFLEKNDLRLSDLVEDDDALHLRIKADEDLTIAAYRYSKHDRSLFFEFFDQKEKSAAKSSAELEKRINNFVSTEKEDALRDFRELAEKRAEVKAVIDSKDVSALIEEKGMSVDENFVIRSSAGEIIGKIELDTESGRIALVDKSNKDFSLEVSDINTALTPFLKKLDTRTALEKLVADAKQGIEEIIQDDGFQLLLSQNNLSVSTSPRVDNLRYYYDVFDGEGDAISSIAVEKSTGLVYITNPDGTNAQNIFFFEPESKKKTMNIPDDIPDYSSILTDTGGEGTLNILVGGFAGALLDSMIFVHINHDRGDIRMISIPRDLFYQGRKINAFAHFYGMDELKRVIGDITGYKPDKYIAIDMFAFIDVIDIIGGVEVTLERALIDPTYRVKDNGVVSTLHYEPGTYHLSGVEALRLARSRYTTSDFARAERQQMILEAIQDKARNFGFGDTDIIYQVIRAVLRKTDTDISLDEAVVWFFRYQNYDVKAGNVMSSGNVLYVPPYITAENCRKLIEEAEAAGEEIPDCESQNQAYTLLPRNDNWNVIKWYFREIFED